MDLNKLSYEAYGNIVIIVLIIIALLFNLFPFSLIGFVMSIIQIPIYLYVRYKFKEPIHANGLNICFFLTILFYVLLYLVIKLSFLLIGNNGAFILSSLLCILGCYSTSTLPNAKEEKGKLFFGYKAKNEPSKYQDIEDYIKYNEFSDDLHDFEQKLGKNDNLLYLIYKYRFKDRKTFKDISDLLQIDNPRIVEALDKISLAIRINCKF